ncbi:hypothetical protein C8Q72DRAFT_883752 [Fomitopsis betulina]|nr:hypothetical protein C8Q72DRAFT_883752 [Fomitopsis betulina]
MSLESFMQTDIFNLLHHDNDDEETLPLVNLWFDLEQHLSDGNIPSPFDAEKECDAIAMIVRDAHSGHPDVPFPHQRTVDVSSERRR